MPDSNGANASGWTAASAPESPAPERGDTSPGETSGGTSRGVSRLRRAIRRVPVELAILLFLAGVTRFAFLFDPDAIVFDESFFREFALHYQDGTYYFDLHPPFAKLLLGAWAAVAGATAAPMGPDAEVVIRVLPALFGTVLIGVVYAFIRVVSHSRRIATLGAGFILLDNAILVESRITVMDSMLLTFGIAAVTVALIARQRTGRAYWWLLAASAALGGCAVSTKLTGVGCFGLVGLLWLVDVVRERRNWKAVLGQVAILAVIPLTIYVGSFAIHLTLLQKSGPGDAFMSTDFQATLKGNPLYRPDAKMSLPRKIADLQRANHEYEIGLNNATHQYASKWYTWPITKRGVYTYVDDVGNGEARYIYILGNPAVWWGTLLGLAVVLIGWLRRRERFRPYRWTMLFLAVGWAANYLPFSAIVRPMFLYHYFFALIFSVTFVAMGLGILTGWIDDRGTPFTFAKKRSTFAYWAILGVALLSFLYFAPITFGIPLTADGLQDRMWLSTWR